MLNIAIIPENEFSIDREKIISKIGLENIDKKNINDYLENILNDAKIYFKSYADV